MKLCIRGLAGTLVVAGILGVAGCGDDNEANANKATQNAPKDIGAVNKNATVVEQKPLPKSHKEFFENQPDPHSQKPQPSR
jgi:hypothetical protein